MEPKALKRMFDYNPATGILISKVYGGARAPGSIVGTLHKCGGKKFDSKSYLRAYVIGYVYVHRIIWIIMTGEQPDCIDHIDGNGLNNKWDNLRSVSHRINCKNQKIHTTNTSGTSGVTYRKESDRWRARIMVDDKMINLGTFKDKTEAIEARKKAELEHGFH